MPLVVPCTPPGGVQRGATQRSAVRSREHHRVGLSRREPLEMLESESARSVEGAPCGGPPRLGRVRLARRCAAGSLGPRRARFATRVEVPSPQARSSPRRRPPNAAPARGPYRSSIASAKRRSTSGARTVVRRTLVAGPGMRHGFSANRRSSTRSEHASQQPIRLRGLQRTARGPQASAYHARVQPQGAVCERTEPKLGSSDVEQVAIELRSCAARAVARSRVCVVSQRSA